MLIGGVGRDAARVALHIATRASARHSDAPPARSSSRARSRASVAR
jgi:hypothetical protein